MLPEFSAARALEYRPGRRGYRSGSARDLERIYKRALARLRQAIGRERDPIANAANAAAVIKAVPKYFWVGFYVARGRQLVLGPFQGTPACTRIPFGRGVCGTSAFERRTVVVPDVRRFPGYIPCDASVRSEIVVPVSSADGALWGVLDADSTRLRDFGAVDARFLERVADLLSPGR